MDRDRINEIGIDERGRLYVTPRSHEFPFIYREAMEIGWDDLGKFLHAPPPPRSELWPSVRWFQQIVAAAKTQDCDLFISPETTWRNIPDNVRQVIMSSTGVVSA